MQQGRRATFVFVRLMQMALQFIEHILAFQTTSGTDILDVTGEVEERVGSSCFHSGMVNLFVPGSTAALTTIEYESGVIHDLRSAIERMAPKDLIYEHDSRWGDGNGYSHVRAALLGPSLTIPILAGRMSLGTWQQIVLLDFDNRPRLRKIIVQIVGVSRPAGKE